VRKRKATFKQPENEQFPGHFPDKGRKKKSEREKNVPHTAITSIMKLERKAVKEGKEQHELIAPCPNMNNSITRPSRDR
jgi:hypothetical protein